MVVVTCRAPLLSVSLSLLLWQVRELVSTAPPQMGAIHFRFAQVGKNLRRAFAVLTTLVITILWWCCCRPRRKVSPAVTSSKKQH